MAKKKTEAKSSVKTYQQDIDAEKQKMGAYSNKFKTTVRSLQSNFKKHARDIKVAALQMREDGVKHMSNKINKFKGELKIAGKIMDDKVRKFNHEVKGQMQENREAVAHMADNVKFFQSEINKKKKEFQSYAHGPFNSYIKAFWG